MKSAKPARTSITSSPGVIKPGREAYIKPKNKTVEYNRVEELSSLLLLSFHAVVVFLSSLIVSLESGFKLMAMSLVDGVRQYRDDGTMEESKSGQAAAIPAKEDNKPLSKAEGELVEIAKHQDGEKKKRKRTPKKTRGGEKAEQEQESGGFETTRSAHSPQADIGATDLIQTGANTGMNDPRNNEGWIVAQSKAKKRAGKKQAIVILQPQAQTKELQVDNAGREHDPNGSIQLSDFGHSDMVSDNCLSKSEHSHICSDPDRPDTPSAELNAPNSPETVEDLDTVEDILSEEIEDNHVMEDHSIDAPTHSQDWYDSDVVEDLQVQSTPNTVWTEVTDKKKRRKSVSALPALKPTSEMSRLSNVGRFAALADGYSDNLSDSHQVPSPTCSGSVRNAGATKAERAQTACETIEWDVTGTETDEEPAVDVVEDDVEDDEMSLPVTEESSFPPSPADRITPHTSMDAGTEMDEERVVDSVEDDEMSSLVTEESSFPPTPADRITPPLSMDAGDSEETAQQMTPQAAKKEEAWKPKNGGVYWADIEDDL